MAPRGEVGKGRGGTGGTAHGRPVDRMQSPTFAVANSVVTARNREERGEMVVRAKP